MGIVLDPHQIEAANFVLEHKKAALFMGCGTGKTFTSLEVYKLAKPRNCLIITTAKLIREDEWTDQIIEYLGHIPDNIELISHQKFSRNYDTYIDKQYDMVVFDEAHKVKAKAKINRGTKIARLMYVLSYRAQYVIPMTGTPVGNDYIDVYNIFRNSHIEMWKDWSELDFIKAYYYYIMKDWSGAGFKVPVPLALKLESEKYIWNLIRKKAFVVKTSDVLDLETQRIKLFYIDDLDKTEIYKNIKKKIIRYKNYEDTLIALKRINFERQAANGFVYEENFDKTPYQFSTKKIDAFARKIPGWIEKMGKTVITYFFKQDRANIEKKLDELGISYTDSKKQFKKDKQVFLLHFSDSEGLNLQLISRFMVFYSYSFSYLNFVQIADRIWRRGQEEVCYYVVMISRGTIEERIWDTIKHKKEKDDFIKNELEEKDD